MLPQYAGDALLPPANCAWPDPLNARHAGVQGEVLGSGKVGRSRVQAAFQLRAPSEAGLAAPASLKAALLDPSLASVGPRPGSYFAQLGKAPRAQVCHLGPAPYARRLSASLAMAADSLGLSSPGPRSIF